MFILDHNAPEPLYVQLSRQIRECVLSGKMPADSKLPSVRDLAAELSVSRNTVESTYLELHAEGFIYARPRSGYFVSTLDRGLVPPVSRPRPRGPGSPNLADAPPQARPVFLYDFHPARLDHESFPAPLWRKYYLESLRDHSPALAGYGEMQGLQRLRVCIQEYLERSRGVVCSPDQVVICAGLQHALSIVAGLFRQSRPRVAVENPGYFLPRLVLRNHGMEAVPVPVRSGGMDLDALRQSGCSVAYVTPSHQFPLGHVIPVENRLKLIEWATEEGHAVIEDDYDSELRYQGEPIPSLQGLSPGGNIFYMGTFSKILSPALRLSYMVLPQATLPEYRRLFGDYQSSSSLLEQSTLARFMEHGHWERHIRRVRTGCKKKHDALLRAIGRHFGDSADIIGQGAGLHVVLRLSGVSIGERELVDRAGEAGIRLFPFSETLDGGGGDSNMLLLGFGAMQPEEIDRGVELLSRVCSGRPVEPFAAGR
ncbi:MAG: GntR family transcriptional regulator / MocR family [Desulfovibrionaceae bacterium]|nr:MAG: GntR family transcriptional regulator / MocR family [Desulfovibrionaceae bacterium]